MDRSLALKALVAYQANMLATHVRTAHMLQYWNRWLRSLHRSDIVDIFKCFQQLLVQIIFRTCVHICISVAVRLVEQLDLEDVLDGEELAGLGRIQAILIHKLAKQVPYFVVQVANFIVYGLFFAFDAFEQVLVDAVRA